VELSGKTLAILGLGRVGRLVAERANAFGMRIVGYDPYLPATTAVPAYIRRVASVEAATSQADFVTVHMPLTDETRNLIDAHAIANMPQGVRIVNAARGGIVNEPALLAALESGQSAGAGLDVFVTEPATDRRLIDHPRVVATPHIGASTADAQNRAGLQVADAVINAFSDRLRSIA
jgi:D-3-phosphoglycerate dehydrogenase